MVIRIVFVQNEKINNNINMTENILANMSAYMMFPSFVQNNMAAYMSHYFTIIMKSTRVTQNGVKILQPVVHHVQVMLSITPPPLTPNMVIRH